MESLVSYSSTPLSMTNNYDHIAKYYDRLSRLIFNKAQLSAQVDQLSFIPENSNILIVGGGTGWILEEICSRLPKGLNICYVEQSAQMLDLAKKVNCRQNKPHYVQSAIQDFHPETTFDVLITAFLFDNFSKQTATQVFRKLYDVLNIHGHWLYSDFSYGAQKGNLWQGLMLKMMYAFFKLIARVEANELPDMSALFKESDCRLVNHNTYYQGFIESAVYEKRAPLKLNSH